MDATVAAIVGIWVGAAVAVIVGVEIVVVDATVVAKVGVVVEVAVAVDVGVIVLVNVGVEMLGGSRLSGTRGWGASCCDARGTPALISLVRGGRRLDREECRCSCNTVDRLLSAVVLLILGKLRGHGLRRWSRMRSHIGRRRLWYRTVETLGIRRCRGCARRPVGTIERPMVRVTSSSTLLVATRMLRRSHCLVLLAAVAGAVWSIAPRALDVRWQGRWSL